MARILSAEHHGDGTVTVRVDVAATVITEVRMPVAAYEIIGPDLLAAAVARRYAARIRGLRGGRS